jgi:hypothetical protein
VSESQDSNPARFVDTSQQSIHLSIDAVPTLDIACEGISDATAVQQPESPRTVQQPESPRTVQQPESPRTVQQAGTSEMTDPWNSHVGNILMDEETEHDVVSTNVRHSEIRKRATRTYLSNANKRIKAHEDAIKDRSFKCSIGDYVGIKIDKVDRTNIDPKILPAKVMEKKDGKIKVASEFGIINQWWALDSVVSLSTVPENLVKLQGSDLPEISLITAAKLYVRGGVDGVCCSCKSSCKTKQCPCRKKNIPCSTKCHKNGTHCVNVGANASM